MHSKTVRKAIGFVQRFRAGKVGRLFISRCYPRHRNSMIVTLVSAIEELSSRVEDAEARTKDSLQMVMVCFDRLDRVAKETETIERLSLSSNFTSKNKSLQEALTTLYELCGRKPSDAVRSASRQA